MFMKKLAGLFFAGIMAVTVLSGCNAESGVQTESITTTPAETEKSAEINGETSAEAESTDDGIIFIGENKIEDLGGYADKNYTVDIDAATENIIKSEIIPDGSELMCSGTTLFRDETYYIIKKVFDNGSSAVTEETFWVNAESGDVYVYLDPTLPVSDNLIKFKNAVAEDDGRSRLIKIFDGNL